MWAVNSIGRFMIIGHPVRCANLSRLFQHIKTHTHSVRSAYYTNLNGPTSVLCTNIAWSCRLTKCNQLDVGVLSQRAAKFHYLALVEGRRQRSEECVLHIKYGVHSFGRVCSETTTSRRWWWWWWCSNQMNVNCTQLGVARRLNWEDHIVAIETGPYG